MTNRSSSKQTTADQPGRSGPAFEVADPRPWDGAGPDGKWWHGETRETPEVPPDSPRRPSPAHRDRPAARAPQRQQPPVEDAPAVAALAGDPGRAGNTGFADGTASADGTGSTDGTGGAAHSDDTAWPAPKLRAGRRPRTVVLSRRPTRVRRTRRPATGLVALFVLGMLAVFLAWVSAEPLWLSVGHATRGTATVSTCRVHGIAQRCANFTPDGDADAATRVALLGTGPVPVGAKVPARMVSRTGSAAYAGSVRMHCALGLLGVLLCGLATAWLTGAYRLPTRRARLVALVLSLAGPAALMAVMLAATW